MPERRRDGECGNDGALDRAMQRALAHDGPSLIVVPIDAHDCSRELREWGSRVAVANGRVPRAAG
jgi:thiamine pyrophosphate-dependent acetolactate synthase large subunit-like protein